MLHVPPTSWYCNSSAEDFQAFQILSELKYLCERLKIIIKHVLQIRMSFFKLVGGWQYFCLLGRQEQLLSITLTWVHNTIRNSPIFIDCIIWAIIMSLEKLPITETLHWRKKLVSRELDFYLLLNSWILVSFFSDLAKIIMSVCHITKRCQTSDAPEPEITFFSKPVKLPFKHKSVKLVMKKIRGIDCLWTNLYYFKGGNLGGGSRLLRQDLILTRYNSMNHAKLILNKYLMTGNSCNLDNTVCFWTAER